MTATDLRKIGEGHIRISHTEQILPRVVRHVTGPNSKGKSVFLSTNEVDSHDHELVNQSAIATMIYSTYQSPVELNNDVGTEDSPEKEARKISIPADVIKAKRQPQISAPNASACHMIDFAPSGISPMQRANTLDCAIVIEGVFRIILDSGEERTIQRGDIVVQQSTAHKWVNVTGNGLLPARIMVVALNSSDLHVAGSEKSQGMLRLPRRDSLLMPSREFEDGSDRGRVGKFGGNDYWESEF